MNRAQMLAILSAMPDDKLTDAISGLGIPMEREPGYESRVPLESWGQRDVAVPMTNRPKLLDQMNLTVKMPEVKKTREYDDGAEPTGLEPMAAQQGMLGMGLLG